MENFTLEKSPGHAELHAVAPYANIEEMQYPGQGWPGAKCVRVYCTQFPNQFNFQIKCSAPIRRKGVVREMLATVNLSVDQIKTLYEFVTQYPEITRPEVKP